MTGTSWPDSVSGPGLSSEAQGENSTAISCKSSRGGGEERRGWAGWPPDTQCGRGTSERVTGPGPALRPAPAGSPRANLLSYLAGLGLLNLPSSLHTSTAEPESLSLKSRVRPGWRMLTRPDYKPPRPFSSRGGRSPEPQHCPARPAGYAHHGCGLYRVSFSFPHLCPP